jgi:DNA-binding MarR family transcriptional regulator
MNHSDGCLSQPCPITYRLLHAASTVEDRVEAALAPFGLSLAKAGVLKHLVAAGETLPLSQLAERISCVKSNITQLVDRLEADGLVKRVADSEDRRSIRAAITPAGRRQYEAAAAAMASSEREIFGELSADERRQLNALLERLSGATVKA